MKIATLKNPLCILTFSLLASGLAACAAGVEDVEIDGNDVDIAAEAEETFTRTIVRLNEDGEEVVDVQLVTRADQLAEQERRALALNGEYEGLGTASDAITRDHGCAGSSIWIYDQVDLAGNEICFYGAGIANLNNYCRTGPPGCSGLCVCTDWWGDDVRSYWAGADWGQFSIGSGFTCGSGGSTCGTFSAWQQAKTVNSCEQAAKYLGLQQLCIPA